MFESHFGLSGPPFQLNADPAFFFGSRGHSHALAYMRFGVHQAEGFIVVTGEVGAGKTTLVRTLMASLEQDRVVAAQVVSTQLEAGDLLRAILAAFGVAAPPTASKAHLISSLEAYLTALAAQGRRALLVIDEAQNLNREAVEELRMLSNFQLGTHGLLQSFLVGQPELRQLLQSRSMEQLRQRVIASCHLGPLDDAETRAYVEHRLKHVGWNGRPRFADDAFAHIYRATGGIPRRINRLCGRLMLGAYLASRDDIAAVDVLQTAQELNAEIGEAEAPVESGAAPVEAEERSAAAAGDRRAGREVDVVSRSASRQRGAVLYWVDSVTDYLKAGVLAKAFAAHPAMPLLVAVHAGGFDELLASLDDGESLPRPDVDIGLRAEGGASADRASVLGRTVVRFADVLSERRPAALITSGASDEALLCGLLALRSGIPLIRSDAGRVQRPSSEAARSNVQMLDRLADLVYTENLVSFHALHKAGIAQDRLQCVGDLAADALHLAEPRLPATEDVLKAIGPAAQRLRRGAGYGVVTCGFDLQAQGAVRMEQMVAALVQCAAEKPLLWLGEDAAIDAMKATGVAQRLGATDLVVVPMPRHLQVLGLLRQADLFVSAPNGRYLEEACAMGLPCATVDADGSVALRGAETDSGRSAQGLGELLRMTRELGSAKSDSTERRTAWDGGAAPRITAHLGAWLRGRSPEGVGRNDAEGGVLGAGS
jgi:general secretion pathway protein A